MCELREGVLRKEELATEGTVPNTRTFKHTNDPLFQGKALSFRRPTTSLKSSEFPRKTAEYQKWGHPTVLTHGLLTQVEKGQIPWEKVTFIIQKSAVFRGKSQTIKSDKNLVKIMSLGLPLKTGVGYRLNRRWLILYLPPFFQSKSGNQNNK